MSGCEQEMCGNWNGGAGCVCDVFDIEVEDRPVARDHADEGIDW